MVVPEHHRALDVAARRGESGFHSSDYAESLFRDERSLANDLARLEAFYKAEGERLRQEARDAIEASKAWK